MIVRQSPARRQSTGRTSCRGSAQEIQPISCAECLANESQDTDCACWSSLYVLGCSSLKVAKMPLWRHLIPRRRKIDFSAGSLFGAASSRWQGDIGSQEYLADTASCDCAEQLTTVIVEPAHEYYIGDTASGRIQPRRRDHEFDRPQSILTARFTRRMSGSKKSRRYLARIARAPTNRCER
jgi:hypothetical protein